MAKQIQLTTQTPLRLHAPVCAAFIRQYRAMIEENGASFAVNFVLAEVLREKGHRLNPLETPLERIARAQKRRWKTTKQEQRAEEKQTAARKQRKAETDRARRLRLKSNTQTTGE